jgi:hypothetical protein
MYEPLTGIDPNEVKVEESMDVGSEKNAITYNVRHEAFIRFDVCGLKRRSGIAFGDGTASAICCQ